MIKEIALQKMLKEMNGSQNSIEDSIHNFLCDQNDEVLFKNIGKEGKSIKGAFDYCFKKAKESAFNSGQGAMVPDEVVFGWVLDYFNDTKNAKAPKKKEVKKVSAKPKVAPTESEETQLSLFDL